MKFALVFVFIFGTQIIWSNCLPVADTAAPKAAPKPEEKKELVLKEAPKQAAKAEPAKDAKQATKTENKKDEKPKTGFKLQAGFSPDQQNNNNKQPGKLQSGYPYGGLFGQDPVISDFPSSGSLYDPISSISQGPYDYPSQPQYGGQYPFDDPSQPPFGGQYPFDDPSQPPFGGQYPFDDPSQPPFGGQYPFDDPSQPPFGGQYPFDDPSQPPFDGQYPFDDPSQPPFGGQYPYGDPSQPPYGGQYPYGDPSQPQYGQYPQPTFSGPGQDSFLDEQWHRLNDQIQREHYNKFHSQQFGQQYDPYGSRYGQPGFSQQLQYPGQGFDSPFGDPFDSPYPQQGFKSLPYGLQGGAPQPQSFDQQFALSSQNKESNDGNKSGQ